MTASLTELEAVNEVLVALGERPINSLSSPPADALQIQAKLASNSKRMQARSNGWWFNREKGVELSADGSGRFLVGSDVLSVYEPEAVRTGTLAVRGNYLWNTAENTDVYTEATKSVDLIRLLALADLPYKFQAYLVAQTAYDLAGSFGMNQTDKQDLLRGLGDAKVQAEEQDSHAEPLNLFDSAYHARAHRGRRSPLDSFNR